MYHLVLDTKLRLLRQLLLHAGEILREDPLEYLRNSQVLKPLRLELLDWLLLVLVLFHRYQLLGHLLD